MRNSAYGLLFGDFVMSNDYLKEYVFEMVLPNNIEPTDRRCSKEILQSLYPVVLTKIYTGNSRALNDLVLTYTVRVTSYNTHDIDTRLEENLTYCANYLESYITSYGIDSLVLSIFETHNPIRAAFTPTNGVVVTWQKK